MPATRRSSDRLDALFSPRGVAVVGAGPDYQKRGGRILGYLERYFEGAVHRVNPSYSEIRGQPCYPSIEAVPDPVDLAIICLRAELVPELVRECGHRGVGAAQVIAAGFGEAGQAGQALNHQLQAAQRETGVRILGPNTAGMRVMRTPARALFATHAADPERGFQLGPTALLAQSGGLSIYLGALQLSALGVGSRYIVDTGNELDVDLADCLHYIAPDPEVTCVGVIAEGGRDGRKLCEAVSAATGQGKAVVVLKIARDDAGATLAQSHTGVLAGRAQLFESQLREAGALIASDEQELLDVMALHALDRVPRGRRLGVVATSGGMCVLVLDLATKNGLELPAPVIPPPSELLDSLPFSQAGNPLDVAGYMTAGPRALENSLRYLAEQPNVDAVLLSQGEMGEAEFAALSQVASTASKPVYYVGVMNPLYMDRLRLARVSQFELPSRLLRALAVATPQSTPPRPVRRSAPPWSATSSATAREQLSGYPDLVLVPTRPVDSAQAAGALQRDLGGPVVLKVESDVIGHKSEHGLVAIAAHAGEVAAAFERLVEARRKSPDPDAQIVLQPHVSGVELALGAYRDPVFGPSVMVASGGIFLEILDDAVFAAAPIEVTKAEAMIRELRGFPLLAGARGRPASDLAAAARALAAISRFFADHPEYESMDVNPLIVREQGAGAVAVDVLSLLART